MSRRCMAALVMIALVLGLVGCGVEQKTPQDYYDMGVRFLSEGNYEEAVLVFSALLEIEPNHVQALTGRGQALQQLGGDENLAAAKADFRAVLDLDDSNEEVWLSLADLYMDTGEESEAVELLANAYAKFGASPELSERIARLQASGALDGQDLSRFGLEPEVVSSIQDFETAQLSQTDTDEITNLLRLCYPYSFFPDNRDLEPVYDCTDPGAEIRAIDFILSRLHSVYTLYYPREELQDVEAYRNPQPDPIGAMLLGDNGYYSIAPGEHTDWILTNVFNLVPSHPGTAVDIPAIDYTSKYYFYENSYYCQQFDGYGDIFYDGINYTLNETVASGDWLYLRYNVTEGGSSADRYALLKKNNAGDRTVWSMCYVGMDPLEDITRFQG